MLIVATLKKVFDELFLMLLCNIYVIMYLYEWI